MQIRQIGNETLSIPQTYQSSKEALIKAPQVSRNYLYAYDVGPDSRTL